MTNNPNNNERPIIDRRPHTDNSCGLRMLTMKEVLQNILKDAHQAHNVLEHTNSHDDIRIVLDKIHGYQVDSRVSQNIKSIIADIRGSVHAMRLHDITRSQMCDMLHKLIAILEEAIAQEEHNEEVEAVRTSFLFMAEHAEEFVDWLNQMNEKQ